MKIMKRIVYTFIATVFFFIIITALTGCGRSTPIPRAPSGAPLVNSYLIAETQGCKIYEVDTSILSASHLYLTKCDFDKSSSVTEVHPEGKTQRKTTNATVGETQDQLNNRLMEETAKRDKEIYSALEKLTPREKELLDLK